MAYADFVTAMMAFFLVMWIVAQNKPVREAVAGYFRDPFGIGAKPGGAGLLPGQETGSPAPKAPTAPKAPSPRVKKRDRDTPPKPKDGDPKSPKGRNAAMLVLHGGDTSVLGTSVLFEEDSAELDDTARKQLTELIPSLLGKLNKVEVRGHSTGRPLPVGSPYQDSWQLCYARCQATLQFLAENGVEPERIRLSQAAAFEPQTLSLDAVSQSQNSRVEIYSLAEFVDDLKGTRDERQLRDQDPHQGRVLVGPKD